MTQERYREYREDLKKQGYSIIETTTWIATEETFRILDERIGKMPWNLIKKVSVDG